jgi:cephalosporin hydroxylase
MKKDIFFNSPYPGEMLPYERFKLFSWITEIRPKLILEVGTGFGGESTFYISEAIKNLNIDCKIYTCDSERTINQNLLSSCNFINFFNWKSNDLITKLVKENLIPDFIMFDGPENPDIAYDDIKFLENYIEDGTYFSMHDWDYHRNYDNNKSTKSIKIREYMEKSDKWLLLEQLHSDKKNSDFDNLPFDSVGLCLYKFKKNENG